MASSQELVDINTCIATWAFFLVIYGVNIYIQKQIVAV